MTYNWSNAKEYEKGKRMSVSKRTKRIYIRLTPSELEEIQEQAQISGLSLSEYVRRRVSGHKVKSRIELKMLSELRRQGGLLKHVFEESRGMYSSKTAVALDNLNLFIKELERTVLSDNEKSEI